MGDDDQRIGIDELSDGIARRDVVADLDEAVLDDRVERRRDIRAVDIERDPVACRPGGDECRFARGELRWRNELFAAQPLGGLELELPLADQGFGLRQLRAPVAHVELDNALTGRDSGAAIGADADDPALRLGLDLDGAVGFRASARDERPLGLACGREPDRLPHLARRGTPPLLSGHGFPAAETGQDPGCQRDGDGRGDQYGIAP